MLSTSLPFLVLAAFAHVPPVTSLLARLPKNRLFPHLSIRPTLPSTRGRFLRVSRQLLDHSLMAPLKSHRRNHSLTRCLLPERSFRIPLFGTGGHRLARAHTDKQTDGHTCWSPHGPSLESTRFPHFLSNMERYPGHTSKRRTKESLRRLLATPKDPKRTKLSQLLLTASLLLSFSLCGISTTIWRINWSPHRDPPDKKLPSAMTSHYSAIREVITSYERHSY